MTTPPENDAKKTSSHSDSNMAELIERLERIEKRLVKEDPKIKIFHKRHPVIFAGITFIGVTLIWYGVWDIISVIPIIKNYFVSTILGVIILLFVARSYKKFTIN